MVSSKADCAGIQRGILDAVVPLVLPHRREVALCGPVLRVEVELVGGEQFSFWAQESGLGFSSVSMPFTDKLFRSPTLENCLVGILKRQTDPKEGKLFSWAIKAITGNWKE